MADRGCVVIPVQVHAHKPACGQPAQCCVQDCDRADAGAPARQAGRNGLDSQHRGPGVAQGVQGGRNACSSRARLAAGRISPQRLTS